MAKCGKSLYSLVHKQKCKALFETQGKSIGRGLCVCEDTQANREILDHYNVPFSVTSKGLEFFV